jgi:hypothetical protein
MKSVRLVFGDNAIVQNRGKLVAVNLTGQNRVKQRKKNSPAEQILKYSYEKTSDLLSGIILLYRIGLS